MTVGTVHGTAGCPPPRRRTAAATGSAGRRPTVCTPISMLGLGATVRRRHPLDAISAVTGLAVRLAVVSAVPEAGRAVRWELIVANRSGHALTLSFGSTQ